MAEVRTDRVVGDAKPASAIGLAVQQQARPRRVALQEPGLVEERGTHAARRIENPGLHQRAHSPPAHRPHTDRLHLHRDRRLLARAQRGDGARVAAGVRQMLEQLADRAQPERPKPARHLR